MAFDSLTPISLSSLAVAAASMGLASLVWWRRLVRVSEMRDIVQRIYALSEEILDLDTTAGLRERVLRGLSGILPVESVQLLDAKPKADAPGAIVLPMSFRGEISGWLELRGPGLKPRSEEISALGHLANQIAIAEQLREQRALQERLLQSERRGAVGQLISSIAAELKPPLQRLRDTRDPAAVERESAEALDMLERLLSFARPDHGQRTPVEIGSMLRDLLELRSEPMRLALVRVEPEVIESPLPVLGARTQLEQALLNVLVFAEQSLASDEHRVIYLTARKEGPWVLIRIRMSAPAGSQAEALLSVSRSVVEAHQGSWRMSSAPDETVIEIRLPASDPVEPPRARKPARALTLLAVNPDGDSMRQLAEAVSNCGHRLVPAAGASDALLLSGRLSFDAILAVEALPDMDWREFRAQAAQAGLRLVMLLPSGAPPPPHSPVLRLPASESEVHSALAALEREPARERAS
ncbi:MAG: hypothetical protein HXY18_11510 [Bryobacteraceae bacterium]|nr:hypothetical protein [Bryobacteraceae bacterium]